MKVNNLLKRIGSVATTAAMLATLGTTGFAADPVDVTGTKNDGSNIKITSVKRTDMGSGVYKFTIGYDSEDTSKQNSIGVTMLTYVMSDRSGISAGTAYNDSTMQIVGVNQEKQTNTTGNIEFSVATSEDSSALSSNALLMTSGQKGLVMIGGDNTTPAVAEFSIPAASWTIASATVNPVSGVSVSNIAYNTSVDDVKTAVYNYINNVTAENGAKTATLTKKAEFTGITIKDSTGVDYAPGKVGNFIVTIPLSNFVIPADSGATIGTGETDKKTVTVEISVAKDAWTASTANTTVGTNNTISVAEGADEAAIIAAIKASSIVLGDDSRQYTLSEKEKNALTIAAKSGAENTYTVTFADSYNGDTQIVTATGLTVDVTVTFTQNVASAVELVNGNTESATAYTWNKDNVSVKADAETADAVKKAVMDKLGAYGVYAKITYTNANTSGGAAQYEYVSASDFAYVADVEKDKVTATVTKEGISITSGNTFEFGYTVTPVYTAEAITVVGTTDYQKATADEDPTVGIKNLRKGLAIKVDGKDIPTEARVEWSDPVIVADGNGYTATITISDITSGELYEKWPTANDGKLTKTVTGKITVKPAGPFEAKSAEGKSLTYTIGTEAAELAAVKTALGNTVVVKDETGTKTADATVSEWSCEENYDANKPGTYTFKASVTEVDTTKVTLPANGLEATASVTLTAITVDATKTVTVNVPVGYTAETVANALPENLTYTNGTLTDTVDVTWTAINADDLDKADGETFTVNGTVNDESDNHIFKFNPKAVTATVTVRNSVESNKAWELGNTGEYNAGTVKVYLPTTAKKDDVVIATLYNAKGEKVGETTSVTLTSDYDVEKYNSVDLTFDKSFNAAGIHANDSYSVKVTVNNTPLTYTVGEGETAASKDSVQGTVYATSSRRPSTGGSTTPEVKSYNVTVKTDDNGKATVNKTKATAGETVAVNAEPNEGYKVKEITAEDINGKSIDVDQKTRTFTMPAGAVTVTVTFEEGTEKPTPDDKGKFKDVPDSFWAAADIYTLREAGIIDGKTADIFDPDGQVTRAEFTKMIVKMFGVEAKDTKVEFADCGEDDWFTPFVAAAVEAGYVKGYSDTEFAPDKVISREEACAILGRAYAKAANSELSFTDKDSIDEYAQPYVALLVEMGFINGYEDGTFRAQNHITRAEAAKIIGCAYRLATASK